MSPVQLFGILMGTGIVQKHVLRKLPNGVIPYVQIALGALGGTAFPEIGPEQGAALGMMAIGAHQAYKIPIKHVTNKSL